MLMIISYFSSFIYLIFFTSVNIISNTFRTILNNNQHSMFLALCFMLMECFFCFKINNLLFDIGLRKYPSIPYFIKHQKSDINKFYLYSSVFIEITTC